MGEAGYSGAHAASSALAARIVRYADLVPCRNAFIDTRTPGSDAKENFTIIGPGVAENPEQFVHITEPHGFNIGGARQPPRCVNSQHSHSTAETFVVHSGHWRFTFGEHGSDAQVTAAPGDLVSFPTNVFRGFENTGEDVGFLWSVLGGDDPGRVVWAPAVFDLARDYGLVLLEDGSLVDTAAGQAVPQGARAMPRTTAEQVAAMHVPAQCDAETMIARLHAPSPRRKELGPGATEIPLIGDGSTRFEWEHGFAVSRLEMVRGSTIGPEVRSTPHVFFVHEGTVRAKVGSETTLLGPGDTITIPVEAERSLEATEDAILFSVTRG